MCTWQAEICLVVQFELDQRENYQYFVREGEEGGLGNRDNARVIGHLCKIGRMKLHFGRQGGARFSLTLCVSGFRLNHTNPMYWKHVEYM